MSFYRPDYTFAFTILLKKKTNHDTFFGITKFYFSNYLRDNVKYWDSCGIYLHWKCNSVFAHQIVRQFVRVVRTVKLLHHSSANQSTQQLSWLSWLLCCFISFLSQNMLGYSSRYYCIVHFVRFLVVIFFHTVFVILIIIWLN